jgi:type III secretion protein S
MGSGVLNELYSMFLAGLIIAGPPMIAAVVIGLLLTILQTAMQIQDQSLPQLVKVIVILVVVIVLGVPLSYPLLENTRRIFASFHAMTR